MTFGEPILKKKCQAVKEVTEAERKIFAAMAQTMQEAKGVGLAAPQVGLDKRLIVIDVGEGLLKLANPEILKKEGREVCEEGCLSVPGIFLKIKRAKKIKVCALNEKNEKIEFVAENLCARAIQHEIDHLNGVLIVDYVSVFRRGKISKKLREFSQSVAL
jgi:peptide deformylase